MGWGVELVVSREFTRGERRGHSRQRKQKKQRHRGKKGDIASSKKRNSVSQGRESMVRDAVRR